MKKLYVIISTIILIACCALVIYTRFNNDEFGPKIEVNKQYIDYSPDCDNAILLKGVVATDVEDGDVSDSLVLSGRYTLPINNAEMVSYTASDTKGNVTVFKVIFIQEKDGKFSIAAYSDYEVDIENGIYKINGTNYVTSETELDTQESSENNSKAVNENSKSSEKNTTASIKPTEVEEKTTVIEEPTTVAEEPTTEIEEPTTIGNKPVIVLKGSTLTVPIGELDLSGKCIRFISTITDDKDSVSDLFKRVSIVGLEKVNLSVAGNYEVRMYCVDKDTYRSEAAILNITVQ